jgi:hypothetical protein
MRDAQRRPQLREPEHGFLPWWFHFLNGAGKGSSFDDVRLARNSPRLLDESGARRAQLRGLLWMPAWLLFPDGMQVLPFLCRFSAAGIDGLTTRYGDRRLKSAKARSRGELGTAWQRRYGDFDINP